MAVGKSFLDQYSVFCVFGSVVGCVVVPLITQSVESLIFSAIVISLTANRFSKKVIIEPSIKNENKEQTKIKGSKDIIQTCKRKKKPPSSTNTNNITPGNQNALYHQLSPSELRKQHREEAERREYEKLKELEKREEEKREKKLKKREERQKRKIHEKKESEKQHIAKEKQTSVEKVSTTKSSPKDDTTSRTNVAKDRTFSSTTFHPSNPVLPMNSNGQQRKNKYEHYRPNIPRFARMAKQRQMGYNNMQHQQHQTQQHQQPITWQRSTPSPENNNCVTIQPKVQSVIGCRKSPEPSFVRSTPSPVIEPVIPEVSCTVEQSGCYTLFGESEETKKMVSIIRMETGLEKVHT